MKKLLIFAFIAILAIGCTQETSGPSCEQDQTFSMEFTNGTNDPYDLFINNEFQQVIMAKSKVTYDIPAGYWNAQVMQISGYNAYPNDKFYSDTYQSCTSYYIVF